MTGAALTGQVVLVTGASTGFGRLTAEAFAARGAMVFAGLREATTRNQAIAHELVALAEKAGRDLRVVDLDVTSVQGPDAPDPREVADAIVGLAETPRGARPLRTSVDRFTRQGVETLAASAASVQRAVFESFGLSDLLGPKA